MIGNCPRCGAQTDDENDLCYQCALRRVAAVYTRTDCDDVSISAPTSQPDEKAICPKCKNCHWLPSYWFGEKVLTCARCLWIQGD